MKADSLSKRQVLGMSITAGVCVANIYYNQPLLHDIALSLGTTDDAVGSIAVLAQAGYGLGLFFLTPLGDKTDRKKLILSLQLCLIAALLGITFATNLFLIGLMSLAIGVLAVAAQVILPMAASLSGSNKGKNVGIIFTGILIGILSARVFSGYIADWFNWRYVYGIAAAMVSVAAVSMYFMLPNQPATFKGTYRQLITTTFYQLKRFPQLRQTALLGALIFGIFCSFWTTLTFHVSGAPFHYGTDTIGLFGLLAIAGALMAPAFGKKADGALPEKSQLITVSMIVAAAAILFIFPTNVWALVIAVLLLDVGVQATQVTNIAMIYMLDEQAHSRINTIYMTSYFIGGATGSLVGILCWKTGGWPLVSLQFCVWALLALVIAFIRFKQAKQQLLLQPQEIVTK
jgi:predicted MFS family arabinose efflux permease